MAATARSASTCATAESFSAQAARRLTLLVTISYKGSRGRSSDGSGSEWTITSVVVGRVNAT